jgi:hypothetical protein
MDKWFPRVMIAGSVVVAFATIWSIETFVQLPTVEGKERGTIFLHPLSRST